jgi:Ca-activated chloride channel homolog
MQLRQILLIFCLKTVILTAQTALDYQRRGDAAYRLDSFQMASDAYRRAAEKDPKNAQIPNFNLGIAQQKARKAQDAISSYELALGAPNTKPELSAKAWHNLGNAAMELSDYKQAISAYQNSLRLNPGDTATKKNLELARRKQQAQDQQKQQEKKEKPQEKQQQQQDEQQQDEQQQEEQQKMKADEMRRALDLLQQEEQKVKRNMQKNQKGQDSGSKKRW